MEELSNETRKAIHREATLEAVNEARKRMRPPARPITDDELFTIIDDDATVRTN